MSYEVSDRIKLEPEKVVVVFVGSCIEVELYTTGSDPVISANLKFEITEQLTSLPPTPVYTYVPDEAQTTQDADKVFDINQLNKDNDFQFYVEMTSLPDVPGARTILRGFIPTPVDDGNGHQAFFTGSIYNKITAVFKTAGGSTLEPPVHVVEKLSKLAVSLGDRPNSAEPSSNDNVPTSVTDLDLFTINPFTK